MITYSQAIPSDLDRIVDIENRVEPLYAADSSCLQKRIDSFDYFLVARNAHVVGYVQAYRWSSPGYETFADIKDYIKFLSKDSKSLYLHFLGVHPDYQNRGIGKQLIKTLISQAKNDGMQDIELVAKESLVAYYEQLGFQPMIQLPDFLPKTTGITMGIMLR